MMERAYENMNIENMDGEKWVSLGCLGYPKYEVSNYGRIKSLSTNGKDTIRKQTLKMVTCILDFLTMKQKQEKPTFYIG